MTRLGEELRVRLDSLRNGHYGEGGPSRAAEPTGTLDAEQLAARIGAPPRAAESSLSSGSAPWRKALKKP